MTMTNCFQLQHNQVWCFSISETAVRKEQVPPENNCLALA